MTQSWATLIVGSASAIIAVGTLFYNSWSNRKQQERNLKENQYISFLTNLISCLAGYGNTDDITVNLQTINLVGSSQVVNATSLLIEKMLANQESGDGHLEKDEQNRLYSNIVKAMREDLYGTKANERFPDELLMVNFIDTRPPMKMS